MTDESGQHNGKAGNGNGMTVRAFGASVNVTGWRAIIVVAFLTVFVGPQLLLIYIVHRGITTIEQTVAAGDMMLNAGREAALGELRVQSQLMSQQHAEIMRSQRDLVDVQREFVAALRRSVR